MSTSDTEIIQGAHSEQGATTVNYGFNHIVVACVWYSDAARTNPQVPLAGSLIVEGKVNGNVGYSTLDLSPLDVTDNTAFASTSIPLSEIRVTPVNVTSGYYYTVTITGNDS